MPGPRLRLIPAAFVAALIALALALPAVAAAVEFPLTIEAGGNGEGAFGCKVNAGPLEECEAEYEESTDVTVIAEPELGSEFVEWIGECDSVVGGECEVEMDAPKTIEAVFDLEEFELTVETEGSGEGFVECQVEGGPYELCLESETYPYGTEVILFAEPEEGSEFVEWSGDCSGVEAECALTVEELLGVTATFAPEPPFELTIEIGGTGSGTVECEVNGGGPEECEVEAEYEEGTELVLVAVANAGSSFAGFSAGSGSAIGCTSTPCSFTIEADSTVTATFTLIARTLSIAKAGTGTGTVQCEINAGPAEACAASYPNGTSVKLKASADAGSEFKGFSAGGGSASACSTSPCTFTIEVDSAVTATFDVQSGGGGGGGSETGGGGSSGGGTGGGGGGGGGGTVAGTATAAGTAMVKSGKAALKLRCSGGPCQGTLKLTARVRQGKKTKNLVIGKASFSLAAGASKTLKVKLSAPAKQELAKGKTIKAKLAGSGIAARTVKLKPAKKK